MKISQILKAVSNKNESGFNELYSELKSKFESEGIEVGAKRVTVNQLKNVLSDEPDFGQQGIFEALHGMSRRVKLSKKQRQQLSQLLKFIEGTKEKNCKHNNLDIIGLIYGGGFSPERIGAELVCKDCRLNVSLNIGSKYYDNKLKKYYTLTQEGLGLEISKGITKQLKEWTDMMNEQGNRREYFKASSSDIIPNPEYTYKIAPKFPHSMEGLKIIDIKKLESKSGQ